MKENGENGKWSIVYMDGEVRLSLEIIQNQIWRNVHFYVSLQSAFFHSPFLVFSALIWNTF